MTVTHKNRNTTSQAMLFLLMFSTLSLFSALTHEGSASVRGAFLSLLGASAATIGFVSGLGELIGYFVRFVFEKLVDRRKLYWPMTIAGYMLEVLGVPALALVGEHGWIAACTLIVIQRMGKAIKKPAKDTILSFAAAEEGVGRSFGIQEGLDQIGAFLGPVLVYVIMLFKTEGSTFRIYSFCFLLLAVPAAVTMFLLFATRSRFPHPERLESEDESYGKSRRNGSFAIYVAASCFFAFGFADYSILIMHISNRFTSMNTGIAGDVSLINSSTLPLLYAGAMLTDAFAALFFGYMYDRYGTKAHACAALLTSTFALFVFGTHSEALVILGVAMWGIGMGAEESIFKAAITNMIPKSNRSKAYGIFEFSFSVCCFAGSWLMGIIYDMSIPLMISVSIGSQLIAILLYMKVGKTDSIYVRKKETAS